MGWGRQLGLTPMRAAGVRGRQGRRRDGRRGGPDRADLRDRRRHRCARQRSATGCCAAASCGSGRRSSRSTAWRSAWSSAAPTPPGIASGLIVVMAFLGNVFTPMDGAHARHRPLHAALRLRRAGPVPADRRVAAGRRARPAVAAVANVLAWTVIFAAAGDVGRAPEPGAHVTADVTRADVPAEPLGEVGLGASRPSGWSSWSSRSSRCSTPTSLAREGASAWPASPASPWPTCWATAVTAAHAWAAPGA